jgi:cobalt/nickel transport protein
MNRSRLNPRGLVLVGLVTSLLVALFLSPHVSQDPDGLDRVAQDEGFEQQATPQPISHSLPFYAVFDEYALRGVPEGIATPLAGLVGTVVCFGVAWGVGKLTVKGKHTNSDEVN